MSSGSIIAILGSLIALLGPILLPYITVDEEEIALRSFQVSTGMISLLLAAGTAVLAFLVLKKRKQTLGWFISLLSLGQIGLMAITYMLVWQLVPCESQGMTLCDPESGGLIFETLVTLDWGLAMVVIGSVASFFGGLAVVASHREYRKDQRFLRVLLTWDGHIIHEKVLFTPAAVTVGEADDVTLQLAAGGLAKHTLLRPGAGDSYTLDVPSGASGSVHVGGQDKPATGTIEVKRGDQGVLSFENDVNVVFHYTSAETAIIAGSSHRENVGLAISFSSVAALIMVLLVSALLSVKEKDRNEVNEALQAKKKELIEVTLEDVEEQLEEEEPEGDEDDTTGKKAEGEEGKFGDPDIDPDKQSKVPKMDGEMVNKIDVKNLGIAKVLGGQQALDGALGTIMAGDTGALSSKMAVAMSGEGGELVIGHGSGGMGFRGTGSGGGGTGGYGRIHGLGAIDTGGGTGRRANVGIGRKTSKKVARLHLAGGRSTGGCDKGDIQKNVRRRAAAIRACYERQLLTKPDLAGKLTVQWTINPEGEVESIKPEGDSLGNNEVTDCVLRALRRIRFKKPDAGICVILWPFVFQPG